jgi:hypothetical protein
MHRNRPLNENRRNGQPASSPTAKSALSTANARPRWDQAARILWYRGRIVKCFGRPSPNVELIFAAFEEQGWPPCIDDPLPTVSGLQSQTSATRHHSQP